MNVCLYFQVHQPLRLRRFTFFDIGGGGGYEDEEANRRIFERVAAGCYLPAMRVLLGVADRMGGEFRFAMSISGLALEQMKKYAPECLQLLGVLAGAGCVEFVAETYFHSLAALYSPEEFRRQVDMHVSAMKEAGLVDVRPAVFRNTELIYDDRIASMVEGMGFSVVLTEGARVLLGGGRPGRVYRAAGCERLVLVPRNGMLSDEIAFRFSRRGYGRGEEGVEDFVRLLLRDEEDDFVGLFVDFETFGEHYGASSGIVDFLGSLPVVLRERHGVGFVTPSEAASSFAPAGVASASRPVSWADVEKDVSAWAGNPMQKAALEFIYGLEEVALRPGTPQGLVNAWRRLQTSDHFYYMSTKAESDGIVHGYFSPYLSPYDAYVNYINAAVDLKERLSRCT